MIKIAQEYRRMRVLGENLKGLILHSSRASQWTYEHPNNCIC